MLHLITESFVESIFAFAYLVLTMQLIAGMSQNGPCDLDVPSRTALASIVFEGRTRRVESFPSWFTRTSTNGGFERQYFNVTVKPRTVYKGELAKDTDGDEYLPVIVGPFSLEEDRVNCVASVVPGLAYVMFLSGNGTVASRQMMYYQLSGFPAAFTSETVRLAKRYGCPGCTSPPTVHLVPESAEHTVDVSRKLQLRCVVTGSPTPSVVWFKDSVVITASKRLKIRFDDRHSRSQLRVSKAKVEDSGRYNCRAVSVLGEVLSNYTHVVVRTAVVSKPHAQICERHNYCLNGGTCYVLPAIGRKFCECGSSYSGHRCQDRVFVFPFPSNWRESFEPLLVPLTLFLVFCVLIIICLLLCCLLCCGPRQRPLFGDRRQTPRQISANNVRQQQQPLQPAQNGPVLVAKPVPTRPAIANSSTQTESRVVDRQREFLAQLRAPDDRQPNRRSAVGAVSDVCAIGASDYRRSMTEPPHHQQSMMAVAAESAGAFVNKRCVSVRSDIRARKGGISEERLSPEDEGCDVRDAVTAPTTADVIRSDISPLPFVPQLENTHCPTTSSSIRKTPPPIIPFATAADETNPEALRRKDFIAFRSQSDRFDREAVKQSNDIPVCESRRPRSDDFDHIATKASKNCTPLSDIARNLPACQSMGLDATNNAVADQNMVNQTGILDPNQEYGEFIGAGIQSPDVSASQWKNPDTFLSSSFPPMDGFDSLNHIDDILVERLCDPINHNIHDNSLPPKGVLSKFDYNGGCSQPYSDGDLKALGKAQLPSSYSDLCRPHPSGDNYSTSSNHRRVPNCLLPDRRLSDYEVNRSLAASDLEVNMESEADVQALNASEEDMCGDSCGRLSSRAMYFGRTGRDESSLESSDSDSSESSHERSMFCRMRSKGRHGKKSIADSSADDERQSDVDWLMHHTASFGPTDGLLISSDEMFSLNRNDILYAKKYENRFGGAAKSIAEPPIGVENEQIELVENYDAEQQKNGKKEDSDEQIVVINGDVETSSNQGRFPYDPDPEATVV